MNKDILHKTVSGLFFLSLTIYFPLVWSGTEGQAFGQSPSFTVIQNGPSSGDSSYYDVCRVGTNEFWAIGKNGVITTFGTHGINEVPTYPNRGVDLLNMALLDDDNYLLCADKGIIYHFTKSTSAWDVIQVAGYENSCFYSICSIDKNTAFISGGRSKILNSQRAVPFGFILKTENGGKTWKKVFSSMAGMIWSVKYDKESQQVLALVYSPAASRLISSSDKGTTWYKKEKKVKGLFHDFYFADGKLILAGAKNGNFGKNGTIRSGTENFMKIETGMFWDVDVNRNISIASGSKGSLFCKNNSDDWKLVHSPVKNNLYEICFIDQNSAFIVGNSKTILRVDFK